MEFSVEHIGMPARNPASMKDWFTKTLGATVVFSTPQIPPAYFVQLSDGPIFEIYQATRSRQEVSDNSMAGFRHIALRVKDLAKARDWLASRGVNWTEEP